MELPQPPLYGEQGVYPKTHDFLQPLERVDKHSSKEESMPEKPAPPVATSSGEHVLPGGIGTYSISNISYFNQRVLKPEASIFTVAQTSGADVYNEENSNCSSHTGSGFTLWEESAVKKGKTRKENHSGHTHSTRGKYRGKIGGQWAALERPSQSCSNIATSTPNHLTSTTSFSSRFSSQPQSQNNQSFMDMLKSAEAAHDENDDDEEEYILKKDASPPPLKGESTVRVKSGVGKSTDRKHSTPRSKHSATEQRRRSKINDRFHMLRELIPHRDQKRDKASFLLEVIEYIQYLQEKVHKYEGTYQGWNQELPKLMPLQRSNNDAEGYVDQYLNQNSDPVPTMAFEAKLDKNGINFSPTNPLNVQKTTKPDIKTITPLTAIDHLFGLTKNQAPAVQENIFRPCGNVSTIPPTPARDVSNIQNTISHPKPQSWQGMPRVPDCDPASNKQKEPDLAIESGVISISSVYSQGLSNMITQALLSSGVDVTGQHISASRSWEEKG